MNDWKPSVGKYAKQKVHPNATPALVLITEKAEHVDRYGVRYIPSGGGSFWWDPILFEPVTDPHEIAICNKHAAESAVKDAESKLKEARNALAIASGVLAVFEQSKAGAA